MLRGIYHEKVGIITDREGNRLSFSGSINETGAGWISNRESFHVHLSWEGGRDVKHVQDEVEAFEKLWEGRAWSVRVLDFPEAAKAQLLEFLPTDNRFVTPPRPRRSRIQNPNRHRYASSPSAAPRRSPSRGLDLHPERGPGLERFPGG